jgi:transcriptional regulator with XRE-family HTH domain
MANMPQATKEEFGSFLRRIRSSRGISQDQLAQMMGCSRNYIWRLEKGQRNPSRMFLRFLGTLGLVSGPRDQHLLGVFEATSDERERLRLL